jgi:thiamine-phosphate pyrophosphorylase
MLRCAITDRTLWTGNEHERQDALVHHAVQWSQQGIDLIQLREKDLPDDALTQLARRVLEAIRTTHTRLLINSTVKVAVAIGAHGVHVTSKPDAIKPDEVRWLYAEAGLAAPIITVSCHNLAEIEQARANKVDAILFSPVFGKVIEGGTVLPGQGLAVLKGACIAAAPVPVYALGSVTFENAPLCMRAGAVGIAGIRLFHDRV